MSVDGAGLADALASALPSAALTLAGLTPEHIDPGHPSYAHLTSAYVFVQGVGYLLVALNPRRNIDLVRLGALHKLVYCGIAVYYLFGGRLLSNIFGWFALFDAGFFALFVAYLRRDRA